MKDLLHVPKDELEKNQIVDWAYTQELESKTFNEYLDWVSKDLHGDLKYLADERKDLRRSLSDFYPQAQSSLVFLFSYQAAAKKNLIENDHKIASYVKGFDGLDYHYWIKDKLLNLSKLLGLKEGSFRLSIDMQPVLERDLAYRAGLGWFGKNSMLISKKHGSFFIIASIILDKKLNLETINIETDHCGHCTKCIDACPTNAIIDNKTIDSKKCISHFTIELFKDVQRPKEFKDDREEIFGCDVCQSVCPWNTKPLRNIQSEAKDVLSFFNQDIEVIKTKLEAMSNREFRRVFKATPLERTGRVGLLKNIKITS